MDDGERIAVFLETYASRLETWVQALASAGPANAGVSSAAPANAGAARDPLAAILDEILEDLGSAANGIPPSLQQLRAAIARGEVTPRELAEAAIASDPELIERLADRIGMTAAACRAVGNLLARPLLRAAAGSTPMPPGGAPGAECPVCGRFVSMAFLLPDGGKRMLWCAACGSTWAAERLACPACGTADQGALGYLSIEGDSARRIDTCRACGGYLKTVDLRERGLTWTLARADLELLRSADLDLLAAREGFAPMGSAAVPTT